MFMVTFLLLIAIPQSLTKHISSTSISLLTKQKSWGCLSGFFPRGAVTGHPANRSLTQAPHEGMVNSLVADTRTKQSFGFWAAIDLFRLMTSEQSLTLWQLDSNPVMVEII